MRRIIEEDSTAYRNDIIASMIELESEVGVDLVQNLYFVWETRI